MTSSTLPVSTPAAEGIDAAGIEGFLDALEAAADIEPHSLMIVRHGHMVAAGWWAPYTAGRPHLLYSLSKSFTSTALGFAVGEGLIGLDDAVVDYFPEFQADITDVGSRSIKVRHAASMATGHLVDTWDAAVRTDVAEAVRGFLLLPPDRAPGSVFAYNQPATYSIATIIQRLTGQTLSQYLRPRLFDPLGIGEVGWQQHPSGRDLGFTGLHTTTDAIARLGLLYLQHGAWDGRQLLTEEWVAEATRKQVANPDEPNPDWQQGYGFQFWMARHGYRGDGAFGQFCIVLPAQDTVIAITSATKDMQSVLDAVWAHVMPALGNTSRAETDADSALQQRLAALALPAVRGAAGPSDAADWADRTFTAAAGGSEDRASLVGVEVHIDESGCQVVLRDAESHLPLTVGTAGWHVSENATVPGEGVVPVAASGGWSDADTLRFDVIFLETPHRLQVTCDRSSGRFVADWVTKALHGDRLRTMRSPIPPS
ncbi:MAG: serine hydrolase domain-containing protein [Jatrophihabitans sp.]